jgi:PAS domain S-box-containing protein
MKVSDLDEQKFDCLYGANRFPAWIVDTSTLRLRAVNEAVTAIFGFSRTELLQMDLPQLAPAGKGPALEASLRAVPDGRPPAGIWELRVRGGDIIEVELFAYPLVYGGDNAVLMLAFDVTERQALHRAIIEAGCREKERLAQELHDGLGQQLVAMAYLLSGLKKRLQLRAPEAVTEVAQLEQLAHRSIELCRGTARGILPLYRSGEHLESALRETVKLFDDTGGTEVRFEGPAGRLPSLDAQVNADLYRIAQEALSNALRHSQARTIVISLDVDGSRIRLEVSDDGHGIVGYRGGMAGLGLETMTFRANRIGARLTVSRRDTGGTVVRCEYPMISV